MGSDGRRCGGCNLCNNRTSTGKIDFLKTALLTIGNELLSGVIDNTNASWLGRTFLENGFSVTQVLTVGDSAEEIRSAIQHLWENHEVIIVTGGLGPTHDDVTKTVVAEYFGSELKLHEPTLKILSERLSKRNIPVTKQHQEQAMLPADTEVIPNHAGTAAGIHYNRDGKHLFCTPGVPHEMQVMVEQEILPRLNELRAQPIETRILRTAGVPESELYKRVKDLVDPLPPSMVAFLPHIFGVDVRLIANDQEKIDAVMQSIHQRLGSAVYSTENRLINAVIGDLLRERKLTIATAESCTGGLLADTLTDVPGSSDYFQRGFVTYSNQAKMDELDVPEKMLIEHGAVSEEVARAMALGAQKAAKVDVAVSTTGIAGPSGDTVEKPIGLVYIAIAVAEKVDVFKYQFGNERRINKERTVYTALNRLRLKLSDSNL